VSAAARLDGSSRAGAAPRASAERKHERPGPHVVAAPTFAQQRLLAPLPQQGFELGDALVGNLFRGREKHGARRVGRKAQGWPAVVRDDDPGRASDEARRASVLNHALDQIAFEPIPDAQNSCRWIEANKLDDPELSIAHDLLVPVRIGAIGPARDLHAKLWSTALPGFPRVELLVSN